MENAMFPNNRFGHYMLKEIFEEPAVVKKTIDEELERTSKIAQEIKSEDYEMMYITGSGTSYHAGLASQYALSNLTNLVTSIIPASEFQRWVPTKISKKVLLMAISQSGESSDVLEAAEAASERGMTVLAVTNTPESKLAKMSHYHLFPRSGRELAIPATKTYVTQLASIFMLSVELAEEGSGSADLVQIRDGLRKAPQLIEETLGSMNDQIKAMAEKYRDKNHVFLLGSGPNYATALEGALKLKETSTIFAEGFATREFLHGPLRLVDERTLMIMLFSPDETDIYLNLGRSLRNFGAPVIFVSESSARSAELNEASDETVLVPPGLPKVFSPILYIIPIQLFAYHSCVCRGLNPDKPEKLSKVVK
jgi:glucosamine--fructose-6-phosphate aminotransferase (isomerizing)